MRTMAAIVALISLVLLILNWNTPLAVAWCVALCGWIPHMFEPTKEVLHGHNG